MIAWTANKDNKRWSACFPKNNEYKIKGLGYRTTDATARDYVGIGECMERNVDDEWCQNCNTISGK